MENILGKFKDEFNDSVVYSDNGIVFLEASIKRLVFNKKKKYEDIFVKKEFTDLTELMGYLRDVRFDCSINFELKDVVAPILASLYGNKKNKINLGV